MLKYLSVFSRILIKDRPFRKSLWKNLRFLLAENKPTHSSTILINLTEHMGDIVAAEPISRQLRKDNPDARIIWVVNVKFTDLVLHNPALDNMLTVTCIAEWIVLKKLVGHRLTVHDLHLKGRSCRKYKLTNKNNNASGIDIFNYLDKGSLLDVFVKTAGLTYPDDDAPRFHLSRNAHDKVKLPYDYIVLHPLANDAERNWTAEGWNKLVEKLLQAHPHLHIVEIGLSSVISNNSSRFHDLTAKFSLQQLAYIIKGARLFIGVESGFAHFANALRTNSAVMIGYFQHYKRYMVYTGAFATGENCILHYHDGLLNEMTLAEFWPSVESRLPAASISALAKA
ncbi:MAG: hypothetical protein EOO04_04605 [Chitinophagaceae bacterium]|nr:MAG: hypothetical protein EOO04_04605 [Chitinophagaceae bacterium]